MSRYLCNSNHVENLSGGRMIAPSEIVELSKQEASQAHNALLIERKILVKTKPAKKQKKTVEGDTA